MHLVGYFYSCITMHGFMNVKLFFLKTLNIEQTELHERKTDGQIQTLIYAQIAYTERGVVCGFNNRHFESDLPHLGC